MKKIFGFLILAYLLPSIASAQCGDCLEKYELGKGPGEIFYGENIDGIITGYVSNNIAVPVSLTVIQNGQEVATSVTCKMGLNNFRSMQNSYCVGKNYLLIHLKWSAGYYSPFTSTWVPGHYEIIGWEQRQFAS